MRTRLGSPRVGATAVLAMMVALVLGACGSDKKSPARVVVPDATTTSSSVVTDATTTTMATTTAGPTTTRRPGSTTTLMRSTVPAPTTITPPAAGRYLYDTSGSSTLGTAVTPLPTTTSLVVDAPSGSSQHSVRSLKDGAGMGLSTEFVLDYRADGVYLVQATSNVTLGTYSDDTPLRPPAPVMFIPVNAAPGTHVEADIPTGGPEPTLHFVLDVVSQEVLTVAGRSVTALQVRSVITLPPGAITGTMESTLWYDRASRLIVKESSKTDASALGGLVKFTSHHEATLRSFISA